MENYFYLNAQNEQKGPVPGEELVKYGVTRTSLVWKEGMAQWLPAGDVPELKSLFEASVPPVAPPVSRTNSQPVPPAQKPDNFLVWAILATVLCCLPFGVVSIVYAVKVDNLWNTGRYEEAERAAKNARTFFWISLGLGIVSFVIAFFTGVMGVLFGV